MSTRYRKTVQSDELHNNQYIQINCCAKKIQARIHDGYVRVDLRAVPVAAAAVGLGQLRFRGWPIVLQRDLGGSRPSHGHNVIHLVPLYRRPRDTSRDNRQ